MVVAVADKSLAASRPWDKSYEFKAVTLMALGFGVVGLDRYIIYPLSPIIQKDLGLSYQDLGLISAVLALTWGLASVFSGPFADRVGHKPVLVGATVVFSLLVATTGLATGVLSLIVVRAVMGFAEGSFLPASIVTTVAASKPNRVGLNVGIQQMAAPLVGFGMAPLIAVGLLKVVPSWHWVFAVAAVPGLIVALLIAKVLRRDLPGSVIGAKHQGGTGFLQAIRTRNIIFSTIGMCCFLTTPMVLSTFLPNYLTDYLKLDVDQMGGFLAGQGLLAFVGMVAVPAVSDKLGRKAVMMGAILIHFAAMCSVMLVGTNPGLLFVLLAIGSFMNAGVISINVGPLTSESVPRAIAATATGLVIGIGEMFGGALAPAIAGGMADAFGIQVIFKIAVAAIAVAILAVGLGIQEPRAAILQSAPA